MICRILIVCWILTGPGALFANPVSTERVTASLVAEHSWVAPGDAVHLALVLDIRPGWHTYWRNPGDSGEAPRIQWTLPPGVTAGPIEWPVPERIPVGPLANYGYSGRALHRIPLAIPADWSAGEPIAIRADVDWLVCKEECIPESASLELTLATAAETGPTDPVVAGIFDTIEERLPSTEPVEAALLGSGIELVLSIDLAVLPFPPGEAYFFAGEWGLIEHAAPQSLELSDGRLLLRLSPGLNAASAGPDGLLVIARDQQRAALDLSVTRATDVASSHAPETPLSFPVALGLALLGGLILNLMPCVFPVLAIKALSLTSQGAAKTPERIGHGLAYTGGVLAFFALLGILLMSLRAGGALVGWGFQLQSPIFVSLMAYLFFVLGLSLAGAARIGDRLMGVGGGWTGTGAGGAFATGALAALVAAPCTAPFMGAALGYAVTLPWLPALAIILAVGLGLALPFLMIALVPGLARRLPKPGRWMETLKQGFAFPMFATAAWLVWVLGIQTGSDGVGLVLAGMVLLAFAFWLRDRLLFRPRLAALSLAVGVIAALALGVSVRTVPDVSPGAPEQAAGGLRSTPYSVDRLEDARTAGRPVFVNMTAAWCITCLVNERVALSSDAVAAAFTEQDVLYLKGDWTRRDPEITAYLNSFGRTGVPLYVFYPSGADPVLLPQLLTEQIVRSALVKPDAISPSVSEQVVSSNH